MGLKTYSINILESGTVSLTAGTAHADFPLARLYDRDIGDIFKTTAAETTEIKVDLGASGPYQSIDTAIIASGHNLDGETIDIQYSDNGTAWSDATTQFTGTAGTIIKILTGGQRRYWRLKITSPSAAIEITELFFSPVYEWEKNPSYPLYDIEDTHNTTRIASVGGANHYLKLGDPKKIRNYLLPQMRTAQKDNLLNLWSEWGGYKPFFINDHEDNLFFAEFEGGILLGEEINSLFNADLTIREVLG